MSFSWPVSKAIDQKIDGFFDLLPVRLSVHHSLPNRVWLTLAISWVITGSIAGHKR